MDYRSWPSHSAPRKHVQDLNFQEDFLAIEDQHHEPANCHKSESKQQRRETRTRQRRKSVLEDISPERNIFAAEVYLPNKQELRQEYGKDESSDGVLAKHQKRRYPTLSPILYFDQPVAQRQQQTSEPGSKDDVRTA